MSQPARSSSSPGRPLTILTTLVATALVFGATLPTAAAAPAAAPPCQDAGSVESQSRCVTATVALDHLPAVGESTTARISIVSTVATADARLAIRLSPGLRVDGPTRTVGLDQVSERRLSLTGRTQEIAVRVTATSPGAAQIQADVSGPSRAHSAHGTTELVVGARPGTSRQGTAGTTVAAVPVSASAARTSSSKSASAAAAADQICASGKFSYAAGDNVWPAIRRATVSVVGKKASNSAATTYATGETDSEGKYSLCFTPTVTTMNSVWVTFTSSNPVYQVTNASGTAYTVTEDAKTSVAAGSSLDFGWWAPESTTMRGWHAFDTLNKLWAIRASGTNCWTSRETGTCTKISIQWYAGSTESARFNNAVDYGKRFVYLADADPDSEHLVLHESGHQFMDILNNGWWPPQDCPDGHKLHLSTGPTCAWTEGFANAIAGYVMGDGMFIWPNNGGSIDLMTTKWFDSTKDPSRTNVANGDEAECRVAGALIDLWRNVDGGPAKTFANIQAYKSNTFSEYFNVRRAKSGLSVSSDTRNVVYKHTIDYRNWVATTVLNGSFENGPASWSRYGTYKTEPSSWNYGPVFGSWSTYPAQSGSRYAWFGGYGATSTHTLSQEVTIPQGTSTLSFQLRVATDETGTAANDTFKAQIVDGSTTTTLGTWSNLNAGTAYVKRTADVSSWKGKTVTLKFYGVENSSKLTNFILDSVAITTS